MAYSKPTSGIYQIINIITNKSYIGSASNIRERWNAHKLRLRNNKHHSPYLQNSWNKHGEEVFIFNILARCPKNKEYLLKLEQFYLDTLKPEYNIAQTAGSCLGIKLSIERKNQISKSLTGHICSEETKRKISATQKGKKISIETRKKLSDTLQKSLREDNLSFRLSRTKLTIEQIKDIKRMLLIKKPMIDCMKKYNISRTPIYNIKTGRSWADIQI